MVGGGRTASVATGRELRLTERPARFLKEKRKRFQMTYRTCACVRNSPFVDRYNPKFKNRRTIPDGEVVGLETLFNMRVPTGKMHVQIMGNQA